MKTISELGISPAPWTQGRYCSDEDCVYSANGLKVAEDLRDTEARFFAAAPDLYEALRIAYEQITSGNVRFPLPLGWCAKARAALEKAGGVE